MYVHLHNPSIDSSLRMIFTGDKEVYTQDSTYIGQIMIDGSQFKTMTAMGTMSDVFDTLPKAVSHLVGHKNWEFADGPVSNWTRCPKCNALMPPSGCGNCITRRSILHGKILGVLLMEVDYEHERLSNIADKIVEHTDDPGN